jgi:hypothetical protein
MAEVVVNITANTGQATDGVDNLNKSLNQTDVSAAALETTLKKQEAQIKIIDGAINLLGGSVELLAGGLALSGAVTEEQAKQFETAAIGAIAFADGAKRTLDGVKNLNEGLKVYGGVAGVAKKAQLALNKAVLANPYVAVAVAVVALTVAIGTYLALNNDTVDSEKKRYETLQKLNSAQLDQITREEKLSALRGDSIEQQALLQKQAIQSQIDAKYLEKQQVRGEDAVKRTLELIDEIAKLQADLIQVDEETAIKVQKREEQAQKDATTKRKENAAKAVQDRFDALNAENVREQTAIEAHLANIQRIEDEAAAKRIDNRRAIADYENDILMEEFQAVIDNLEARKTAGEKASDDEEERVANLKEAISASLSTLSGFAGALADVQSDTNEEAFEQGKKYKIAQVVTSAIQSAFEAYGAAQKFNGVIPGLGTAIGIANVAAIAIASKKAIQGIQSSTFGGSAPSFSVPNTSTPTVNTGFQGGGQFLPNTAPQGTPPIRAYVVTGDVTNGQVAEQQLQTRRRFG